MISVPERMKKIPETKARMVRCGRTCPMLLRTNPMNMKKRLTKGNGVAERIISEEETARMKAAFQPRNIYKKIVSQRGNVIYLVIKDVN